MLAWCMTTPPPVLPEPAAVRADPRLAPQMAGLAARLGPACRHWEPAAFAALVERIARMQLRWSDRDGRA